MAPRPNSLLQPGSAPAWQRVVYEEQSPERGTLEERLRRGQALSAQAAALRRALPGARSAA